jgi:AraC family transcriptional regulator of adaptative response/methylated-DNA-[protein]-cysteine methyltransferase
MDKALLLNSNHIKTPLGEMIAIANDHTLYHLSFIDPQNADATKVNFQKKLNCPIQEGVTQITTAIKKELASYFLGTLPQFKTPITTQGTPFQKSVWQKLRTLPYGHTWSYTDLAHAIGTPSATRAVANANGKNQHAIIIPCHRVINKNGQLGGYAGGLTRKKQLLKLENIHRNKSSLTHA